MIASQNEPQDPSQSRLTMELAALEQHPALTYRISRRHKRTLIFLQVAPVPPQQHLSIGGEQLQARRNPGRPEVVHNAFMMEETKDRFTLTGHQEYFVERREEGERLKGQREGELEGRVIFTFIFHHDLYPFEAPYITASLSDHWPRVDDGRNYFYDIMRTDCWWPLLSLTDIIQQLPSFAYQLLRSATMQQGPIFGQFQQEIPLYREDLLEVSPHFFACRLKAKQGKGLLRSYRHTWLYFVYSAMLILEEQPANVYLVRSVITVDEIRSIGGRSQQEDYQLEIETREGTQYRLKLAVQSEDELFRRILLFQLYYQSVIEAKAHMQPIKLIDTYNKIIVGADSLGQKEAVRWAKSKILHAATLLQ